MPSARAAFLAGAEPEAPAAAPRPPAAVPSATKQPPPEPPPPPAYKTYITGTPRRAPTPKAEPAPAEPAPAAPAPAAAAAVAPAAAQPPPPAAQPPKPSKAPRAPGPPLGERIKRIDKRIYAIVGTLLVGAALVFGIAALGGADKGPKPQPEATEAAAVLGSKPKPKKTPKPKPKPSPVKGQAQQLDQLMKLSEQGRAAAVKGDFKAATANRAKLVKDLQSLQGKAADPQVKAAAIAFAAAIRESLRQNRECGSKCPTADIKKVGQLKDAAVAKVNPLLKRFGLGPYTSRQI
jgi:2-oxoglutarate dehydrogenase E2 component (dihydrolipoamide succinyltransferase)